MVADTGTDSFDGGDGIDTLDLRYLADAAAVDLVSNPGEVLTSIENLYSGSGSDTLYGSGVANYINGGAGNDTIYGREGDDTLDGAAGNDTLYGGIGNDTYLVDSAADVVTENAAEGVDTVRASLSHTLAVNVENLSLIGTADINGTGNDLDNVLIGNIGANTLTGGLGNDVLKGGDGLDALIGDDGDDVLVWDATDTFDGGAGIDALRFEGPGTLQIDAGKLIDLEVIDLGTGDDNDNGLTLSLADVLDLVAANGSTGLSAHGDDIDLFVTGDASGGVRDNVNLTGAWSQVGTFTSSAVTGAETTFKLYLAAGTQIAVQDGLDMVSA